MYDDIVVPRRLSDIVKGDTALHLDKAAKLVLSSPEVAYRIVHTLIPEANDLPFENFDKTYKPDFKHPAGPVMGPTEDTVEGEGTVYFDIMYSLFDDEGNEIALVDVEAQNDPNPGYEIKNRSAYYCARLISGQFKTEKSRHMKDTYKNLTKVYSIWVLFNCGPETANRIIQYQEQAIALHGKLSPKYDSHDLAKMIMVYLPGDSKTLDVRNENPYSSLVAILATLFDKNLEAEEKCDKIKASGINLTEELKGDVINMCNYSKYIATSEYTSGYESGYENGHESGYESGYESGHEKGAHEERIKAAKTFFSYGLTIEAVQKIYPDLNIELLTYLKSESDSSKRE